VTCNHCNSGHVARASTQLLSRQISLQNGVEALALSYNQPAEPYRVFVQEIDGDSVIEITLRFGYEAASEEIVIYCNPSGAVEYFHTKPLQVRVRAMTADANIAIGVEGDPCVITQRVTSSSTQALTNAAYVTLGDYDGTAPPYTNTVSLYPNGNVDIEIIDISSNPTQTILTKLNLDESSEFLRGLQLGNRYQIQARSVNANGLIGTVWSNYG